MISPPGVPSLQRNSMPLAPAEPVVSAQGLVCVDIIGRSHHDNYITAASDPDEVLTGGSLRLRQENETRPAGEFEGGRRARRLLEAGDRQDPRDVVAGLAIRRDAVELLHRPFAGVVGRQRQIDAPEPVDQRLQVLDAGLDVRLRDRRGCGRCIPARSTASAASAPWRPCGTAPWAGSSTRPGSAPGRASDRRRGPPTSPR